MPERTRSDRFAASRHEPLAHLRPGQPRQHYVVRQPGAAQRPQHVRGTINSEMWNELNKLYLAAGRSDFCRQADESPHEFYQAVECGSHLFQGVCDATLTHDEGWQFIQLGKFLERADKTLRILDIQYHLLHDLIARPTCRCRTCNGAPSCAVAAPMRLTNDLYVGRVEPEHVVEFLLLHPSSRARFVLALSRRRKRWPPSKDWPPAESSAKPDRELGLVLGELQYRDLDEIIDRDLHEFLAVCRNSVCW